MVFCMKEMVIRVSVRLFTLLAVFTILAIRIEGLMMPEVNTVKGLQKGAKDRYAAACTVTEADRPAYRAAFDDTLPPLTAEARLTFYQNGEAVSAESAEMQEDGSLAFVSQADFPIGTKLKIIATLPVNQNDIPALPLEALAEDENGQPIVFLVEETDGVWGRQLIVRAQPVEVLYRGTDYFTAESIDSFGYRYAVSPSRQLLNGEAVKERAK